MRDVLHRARSSATCNLELLYKLVIEPSAKDPRYIGPSSSAS